jgi:hypothetical protein
VDRFRRQRQRGELEDLRPVVRLAVRKTHCGERFRGVRNIDVPEEDEKGCVGRDNLSLDRFGGLRAQLCLLVCGDGCGHLLERLVVDRAFGACSCGHRDEGLIATGQRDLWRRKSTREACAHVGGVLLKVARYVSHLRDVAGVVLRGLEGGAGGLFFIGPEGGVGVQRLLVLAKRLLVDQHHDLRAEDLKIQPLVRRERGRVLRVQLLQYALPVDELRLLRRGIDAGQLSKNPVGIVWIAGAALRLSPGIFRGVDRLELAIFCMDASCRRRERLCSGKRARTHAGQQHQGSDELVGDHANCLSQ